MSTAIRKPARRLGIYYQRLSNQNILQGALGPPFTVQPLSNNANPPSFSLANPFAGQGSGGAIATAFIPQWARFAGLRRVSGTGPLDPNDPNVGPIFINEDGQACLNYGGTATNCVINLASFTSSPVDAYTPYTQQFNLTLRRVVERLGSWAGYVGTRYVGGWESAILLSDIGKSFKPDYREGPAASAIPLQQYRQ